MGEGTGVSAEVTGAEGYYYAVCYCCVVAWGAVWDYFLYSVICELFSSLSLRGLGREREGMGADRKGLVSDIPQ